jgi:ATP-binding cassette subfamily D (ALD) protein 3
VPKIDSVKLVRKGNVDMEFVRNAWTLTKIAIPGWRTPEIAHLVVLSFALVVRTILSIKLSTINGQIVQGIVTKDF